MTTGRSKIKACAAASATFAILGLTAISAPSASAAGGCTNANSKLSSLSNGEINAAFTCLFNQARSAGDVAKNGDLADAARGHSNTMRSKNCFEHKCPGEKGLGERVRATGYLEGASNPHLGEAIAYGPDKASPDDIVDAWLKDPPHRKIIKDASYDDVGVGVNIQGGDVLVTADFGHK